MRLLPVLVLDRAKMDLEAFVAAHPDPVMLFERPADDAVDPLAPTQRLPAAKIQPEHEPGPTMTAAAVEEERLTRRERFTAVAVTGEHGATVRIGRAPTNHLVLPHPSVSRLHAYFRIGDDGVRLEDAGSKNGTQIDGRLLDVGTPRLLGRSTELVFGQLRCRFCEPSALFDILHLIG